MGLGYRQRELLALLQQLDHAVPFGYLTRAGDNGCASSYNNINVALRSLRAHGLVTQPKRGWWQAA